MRVTGYHGTSLSSAKALLSGSAWRPSSNAGDWLGTGSYFFQDGLNRARLWANETCESKGTTPAVLKAELDLTDCFDLLDLPDFGEMRSIAATIPEEILPSQEELYVRGGRAKPPRAQTPLWMRNKMDKFIIDYCVEELAPSRPITAVRSAFLWGHAVAPASFMFNWSRVEIAVRDPQIIRDLVLVP